MNTAEPPLLRWVRSNPYHFWMIIGGLPIGLTLLRMWSYLWEVFSSSLSEALFLLLELLPEVLVLRLFLTYVRHGVEQAAQPAQAQPRLLVQTSTQKIKTGSPREFFWAAAKLWAIFLVLGWLFLYRTFGVYTFGSGFISEVVQLVITATCYSFALRETRRVQQHESHDAASRLLGAAALFFVAQNLLQYGVYLGLFFGTLFFDLWSALLGLGLVCAVLFFEQKRYLLVRATYQRDNPNYQIERVDPLHPVSGLSPLAYWPEVVFDGILCRIDGSASGDPFRNNQVKVPLFLVPTQTEPFVGLLSRRLYLFIGALLLSLCMVFSALSAH